MNQEHKDTKQVESALTSSQNMNYSFDFEEVRDSPDFNELQQTAFRLVHEKYELLAKQTE